MSGIDISSHHWFLLVARPNRVFKAAAALQDRGLVTALPYEWRARRRGSRHCKSVRRFPEPQLGPYLITGFRSATPAWRDLFSDPRLEPLLSGVVSVTSDGLPTPIRHREIGLQWERYGDSLFQIPPSAIIHHAAPNVKFQLGDKVRVGAWRRDSDGYEEFHEGGFAGRTFIVSGIRDEIVSVLFHVFGSERALAVPVRSLIAA